MKKTMQILMVVFFIIALANSEIQFQRATFWRNAAQHAETSEQENILFRKQLEGMAMEAEIHKMNEQRAREQIAVDEVQLKQDGVQLKEDAAELDRGAAGMMRAAVIILRLKQELHDCESNRVESVLGIY